MNENNKKIRSTIPLQTIIIGMVAVGFFISFILLYFMVQTSKSYDEMRSSTQSYIDCQNIATNLLAGSDALTTYACGFVITGDPQQAQLYYNDTQAQNAINEALTEIRGFSVDERVISQLSSAMRLREQLTATEDYAMRLKVEAIGGDISEYPEKLQAVQLLPADMRLSSQEQDEKARQFLFDLDYETSRNEISLRINRGMDILMSSMLTRQVESSDHLFMVLHSQQILTGILMGFLLLLAVVIFTMVIVPLRRQIVSMSSGEIISEEGTSEIRFLARTYNQLHEQNRISAEKLSYKATHDELTGLYNRSAYASRLSKMTEGTEKTALILMDVDYFKSVNDQYGHDIGDAVLKMVADTMHSVFRKNDMVCRIGGDEFAVFMDQADSEIKDMVSEKMRRIAEKLSKPEAGLPPVTISAGVAFADELIPDTNLFKSADLALYKIKNGGRNGFAFSSASGEIETFQLTGNESNMEKGKAEK